MENKPVNTDSDKLRAAFTEWDRRYREDPEAFMNESVRLLDPNETAETYGDAVTPYFMDILESLK